MSVNDWVAIAAFAVSIFGMVFALGKQSYRVQILERDVDNLGGLLRRHDERLDRLSENAAQTSIRISYIEERIFREDTATRMKDM